MIKRLQHITQGLPTISHQQLIEQACNAGIEWIQLRVKDKSYEEWLQIAQEAKEICKQYNVKLIINDNVEIAKAIEADGVHLGKTDMNPSEARKKLGDNAIIGGTANTFEDIKTLSNKGVNYIGLGPFRFTETKKNLSPVLGLEGYKMIIEQCMENNIKTPIIAIGGIKKEDVSALLKTGIYGIAVSSAINLTNNMEETLNDFNRAITTATNELIVQ